MSLDKLRKKQFDIDCQILALLEKRLRISGKIGQFKKENSLEIEDKSVEKGKIEQLQKLIKSEHLSKEFLSKLWQLIFAHSKEIQAKVEIDQSKKK